MAEISLMIYVEFGTKESEESGIIECVVELLLLLL